jgi:mono/diheme cytochrome c family protein
MTTFTSVRKSSGGSSTIRARTALSAALLAACAGCNSLDPVIAENVGPRLVIPTDVRPAFRASKAPPPIAGGTLLVTRAGLAVASDPERDTIVIADLGSATLLATIPLESGDEPGRLVEDAQGLVHVALRRGGAILTVNPATRSVVSRRSVCGAPRGLVLETPDTLTVACADGKLVSLPAAGGEATRVLRLEPDLRDVVATPAGLAVTRFKSAELLRVDATGAVTRRDQAPRVLGTRLVQDPSIPEEENLFGGATMQVVDPFRALAAWRALPGPNGATVVVHQRAVEAEIDIVPPSQGGSSYGGAGSCSGIAQTGISIFGQDGSVKNVTLAGSPLPVDATLMPDGRTLLIAHAGIADPSTPRPFVVFGDEADDTGSSFGGAPFGQFSVSMLTLPDGTGGTTPEDGIAEDPGCSFAGSGLNVPELAVAVAVAANPSRPGQVVVQTTQPSQLVIFNDVFGDAQNRLVINFDDGATLDTGFQLFHRDSGAGIACASCHGEGGEDGHVWRFSGFGERRTQALNIGIKDTAPFHWDGKLPSVGALMSEVFVGRMGGVNESAERLKGFQDWIFSMKAPAPVRNASDEAAVRGQAVFNAAGCGSCHSGARFTNNRTVAVGTSDEPLQVPSLIGIGYRAPFLHDGCAKTLVDRFDPNCGGGELHGATAELGTAQIADLVAFLETL